MSVTVGCRAADALERIDKPVLVPYLSAFVLNSESQSGRLLALRVLKDMGTTACNSFDTLLKVLAHDDDAEIRLNAVRAIVSITNESRDLLPVLRYALSDDDATVRGEAVRGVGSLHAEAEEAIADLLPMLDSDELMGISFSIDTGGWVPIRGEVARALGRIGPASCIALPKLRALLNEDENRSVQISAAMADALITGNASPGLDFLLQVLQEGQNAAQAAEHIHEIIRRHPHLRRDSLEGLTEALSHPNSFVRWRAEQAIAFLDSLGVTNLQQASRCSNRLTRPQGLRVFRRRNRMRRQRVQP